MSPFNITPPPPQKIDFLNPSAHFKSNSKKLVIKVKFARDIKHVLLKCPLCGHYWRESPWRGAPKEVYEIQNYLETECPCGGTLVQWEKPFMVEPEKGEGESGGRAEGEGKKGEGGDENGGESGDDED